MFGNSALKFFGQSSLHILQRPLTNKLTPKNRTFLRS